VDYGEEEGEGERLVGNPRRNALSEERKRARDQLKRYKIQLFDVQQGKTGAKGNIETIRQRIEELERQSKDLLHRIKALPSKVPLKETTDEPPVRLFREKKRFYDTIIMNVYRMETKMAQVIRPFFSRHQHEVRDLARAMFRLSGAIKLAGKTLSIELEPMSSAHRTEALRQLCVVLNETKTRFPDTDLRMTFCVRE